MGPPSSYLTWNFNVFTSFYGPDVRKTFISHLRKQFNSNGITTFNYQGIERSQLLDPALTQAIRESRISIVVLSKNYASSSWCMDELLEILKCKKNGQIVMTVFYEVDPSDVRKQTGGFGIAFKETCAGRAEEERKKWTQALTTVASIAGEYSLNLHNEAKMIEKIARDVANKLKDIYSTDFDSMVGELRKMESGRKVDVFLSFSWEADGAYFRDILLLNGIDTFKSYRCLEKSLIPIDQQTLEALEVSKVAVVIISKTRHFTVGFLEELRVILQFQEKGSLTLIPVLLTPYLVYSVEEDICQQYPENAPSWRTALAKLANIAAEYPLSQYIVGMNRSDRLTQIAHDIYLLLLSSTSNNLNGLVAMHRHMKVVYDLLASEVNNEVRTVGISGSVGVGKTTLARYIYVEISVNFQTHVFLENVENMIEKILKCEEEEEDPTLITSLERNEHEITQARRKHRKVLLIADDVNDIEQGKWIIEYANQFAPGSRVILISQNKNLLVDAGVIDVYEVTSLRYDEALELFSHFAFKQPYPPSDFEQLAVRVVHLSGFLPLSLRLLGSFLNGRDQEEWVAALPKLKTMPGKNIMEVWQLMEATQYKRQEERERELELLRYNELNMDQLDLK